MSDTKFFDIAFAATGTRAEIPDTSPSDGAVSWQSGYGVDYSLDPNTEPQALLVERDFFNGILYDVTLSLAALQTDFPQWVTAAQNGGAPFAYNEGAVVRNPGDGLLYQSTTNENGGTPGVDNSWIIFGSQWALTSALNAEIARAMAAEALKAPIDSPVFTGFPTAPTAAPNTTGNQIATLNFVGGAVGAEKTRAMAAEALLAPIASPTLTGVPRAPTAAPATGGTQLATNAYADAAVLVEVLRAMAAEALLAPLNSPALVGVPTAPTPPGGSADGTIPNTLWVQGLLNLAGSLSNPGWFQFFGFIIQFGTGITVADNTLVTFPTPFPNALLGLTVTAQGGDTSTAGWGPNNTGSFFATNFNRHNSGNPTSGPISYIAVGF